MPIDTNLALGVRPAQIPDPIQNYGRAVQLSSLLQQQDLQGMQMREAQRKLDEDQRYNVAVRDATDLASGKVDVPRAISALAQGGLGSRIPGFQKGIAEQQTAEAKLTKANLENAQVYTEQVNRMLAGLRANPRLTHDDVIQAVAGLSTAGLIPKEMGAQLVRELPGNPQALRDWVDRNAMLGLTVAEQLRRQTPELREVNDGQTIRFVDVNPVTNPQGPGSIQRQVTPDAALADDRARREGAENRAVTMRGQNMTDARAQQAAAAGRIPTGYRQAADGRLEPIPGGPADPGNKEMTDAQSKALLFGSRAQEANAAIARISEQPGGFFRGATDRPGYIKRTAEAALGAVPIVGENLAAGAGAALNWTQSDAQQQVEQAQRDFINAVLRRESGAVISPGEFSNAQRQYFPMVGDSNAVLEQKARNRELAVRGILAEVPQSRRGAIESPAAQAAAPAAPAAPRPGTVQDGYVFIGGDPANPDSWKRAGGGR